MDDNVISTSAVYKKYAALRTSTIINLKIGVPIILLRNIDPPRLYNGTRLAVKKCLNNVIEATILSGNFKGEDMLLPRTPMIPIDMASQLKRLQFPIKLAFAMTIKNHKVNRCKDSYVDSIWRICVFFHGQLYVACSPRSKTKLFSFIPVTKVGLSYLVTRAMHLGCSCLIKICIIVNFISVRGRRKIYKCATFI
jgi:hypothetical protein